MEKLNLNKLTAKDLRSIALATKKIHKTPITGLKKKDLLILINKVNTMQGGGGIISDVWNKIKSIPKKVITKIKEHIFFPPNKLPGNSQKVFNKIKDDVIIGIEIRRDPIQSIITAIINLLSKGKFYEKIKSLGYDKVFHLYMILTLDTGKKVLIEKNERINIKEGSPSLKSDTQVLPVSNVQKITVNEFLENARVKVGDHDFFQYSANNNNCQKFLKSLLESSNMLNSDALEFIMQDAEEIFSSLPNWLAKFAQFITDTAGKVSQHMTGQGKKHKRKIKKHRVPK